MFVTKFIVALFTVTPVLLTLVGSSLPSNAQVAQTLQVSTLGTKQLETEFTPPPDSDAGDDLISTSTGTYFRPPQDSRQLSGPATTGGSRQGSCLGVTDTTFTTFGPKAADVVAGQTVSSRPDFVWYLPESDATFPVIFRLLAPNENDLPDVVFEERLDYTPGFVKYQLPQSAAALSPGINYRWQVIIECNPAYPSRSLVQELQFEVVTPTAALSQALSAATTDTERAIAYGQAGIWYDAIAQVAQATTPAEQQTRRGLLSDLASTTDSEPLQQDILKIVETTTTP